MTYMLPSSQNVFNLLNRRQWSSYDSITPPSVHVRLCPTIPPQESLAFDKLPLTVDVSPLTSPYPTAAVCDEGGGVTVVSLAARARLSVRQTFRAHNNAVFDCAHSYDGTAIVTASGDMTCAVTDIVSGSARYTYRGHTTTVKTVDAHSNNDALFASGSRDGTAHVWDCRTNKNTVSINVAPHKISSRRCAHFYRKHSVTAVCFIPNSTLLATGTDADSGIKIWDLRYAPNIAQRRYTNPVYSLETCLQRKHNNCRTASLTTDSNGSRLLVASTNDRLYEFDLLRPESHRRTVYCGHHSSFYTKVAYNMDASLIASGSVDDNVYVWKHQPLDMSSSNNAHDVGHPNYMIEPSNSPVCVLTNGHSDETNGIAWSAHEWNTLLSTSDDCTVRLWDINYKPPQSETDDDIMNGLSAVKIHSPTITRHDTSTASSDTNDALASEDDSADQGNQDESDNDEDDDDQDEDEEEHEDSVESEGADDHGNDDYGDSNDDDDDDDDDDDNDDNGVSIGEFEFVWADESENKENHPPSRRTSTEMVTQFVALSNMTSVIRSVRNAMTIPAVAPQPTRVQSEPPPSTPSVHAIPTDMSPISAAHTPRSELLMSDIQRRRRLALHSVRRSPTRIRRRIQRNIIATNPTSIPPTSQPVTRTHDDIDTTNDSSMSDGSQNSRTSKRTKSMTESPESNSSHKRTRTLFDFWTTTRNNPVDTSSNTTSTTDTAEAASSSTSTNEQQLDCNQQQLSDDIPSSLSSDL